MDAHSPHINPWNTFLGNLDGCISKCIKWKDVSEVSELTYTFNKCIWRYSR